MGVLFGSSFGGFGLAGALGFIALISGGVFMFARSKRKNSNIEQKAVVEYKQQESIKKIEAIDNTQKKILAEINERTDIDKRVKRKIHDVVKHAVTKVKEVEKKQTVKEVNDLLMDEWDNI